MNFGDVLWTLLIIFFMMAYFILLFGVVLDLFRNRELSGWGKAGWALALLVFPGISLVVYLIVYGKRMNQWDVDSRVGRDVSRAWEVQRMKLRPDNCELPAQPAIPRRIRLQRIPLGPKLRDDFGALM